MDVRLSPRSAWKRLARFVDFLWRRLRSGDTYQSDACKTSATIRGMLPHKRSPACLYAWTSRYERRMTKAHQEDCAHRQHTCSRCILVGSHHTWDARFWRTRHCHRGTLLLKSLQLKGLFHCELLWEIRSRYRKSARQRDARMSYHTLGTCYKKHDYQQCSFHQGNGRLLTAITIAILEIECHLCSWACSILHPDLLFWP